MPLLRNCQENQPLSSTEPMSRNYLPTSTLGTRPSAAARGFATSAVFALVLAITARADMYRPAPIPGGVDPHPIITSLSKNGTNATLNWYGLQGTYHVQQTPSLTNPNWTDVGQAIAWDHAWGFNVNAQGPQNFYRVSPENGYLGAVECSGCHADKYTSWQQTGHAKALSQLDSIPPAVKQSCIVCHTVGFGQSSGFANTNTTPHLANVQCENCHGPAAAHVYGDVRPVKSLSAEICGGCHDDSHHPTYSEWSQSAHTEVTEDVAAGISDTASGQSRMMSCGPCHSGAVRLAMLGNYKDAQRGYNNPLALPAGNDAKAFGPTCAVCHDSHATNSNPYQLRNPLTSTNFFTFYTGSSTNQWGQYLNTVFSTQYVASVQICAQCHNSRGARWTDTSRPPHHSPQYNILLGNAGELATGTATYQPGAHAALTNQCIACHMHSQPYTSEQSPAITGHSFRVESLEICSQCHTDPQGVLQFTTSAIDYQIQQVKAGLDFWATTKAPAALRTKYGTRAWEYTNPGGLSSGGSGPTTGEQALLPANIRKARYNMYLVLHDGTYGVHNPLFAVTLLDTAYTWVQQELAK